MWLLCARCLGFLVSGHNWDAWCEARTVAYASPPIFDHVASLDQCIARIFARRSSPSLHEAFNRVPEDVLNEASHFA